MKRVEQLREYGYFYDGYHLPPLSSKEPFPDYISEEALSAVERIKSHYSAQSVHFAFMADQHYIPNENQDIRLARALNSYQLIAKEADVPKLILGGDYTVDGDKVHKIDFLKAYKKHLEGMEYYPVHGNHDDGTIWDKAFACYDKTVNFVTHCELQQLFYDHLSDLGAVMGEEPGALYYFCDDKENKVRYVFLDSSDIPYIWEEGVLRYLGIYTLAVSQKQVNWLTQKALHFEDAGWSVVFLVHAAPVNTLPKSVQGNPRLQVLLDIADCFKRREKLEKRFYEGDFVLEVQADFTEVAPAEVVGFFVGHFHVDAVGYTETGIPVIATGNSGMYQSPGTERRDGDKTELLYDIVTID